MFAAEDSVHSSRVSTLGFVAIAILNVALGSAFAVTSDDQPLALMGAELPWAFVGVLAGVLWVRSSQRPTGALLAMACDLRPIFTLVATAVVVVATMESALPLALDGAVVVTVSAAGSIRLRVAPNVQPSWVTTAPHFDIAVANVFTGNRTPHQTVAMLLESDADVIVVNEASSRFMQVFDELGGSRQYPTRVIDAENEEDYRVAIVSRLPFATSDVRTSGALRHASAVISVGGRAVTVIATHLHSPLERGGQARWLGEMRELTQLLSNVAEPTIVAGDLNATIDHPQIQALLKLGFQDAPTTLGRRHWTSLRLAASGPLRHLPTAVRVDHVLTGPGTRATQLRVTDAPGSDHIPFVVTIAILPAVVTHD
jgi:endonuclease/exonuclease/phosphatase (EEP) superfamily protein YafD